MTLVDGHGSGGPLFFDLSQRMIPLEGREHFPERWIKEKKWGNNKVARFGGQRSGYIKNERAET